MTKEQIGQIRRDLGATRVQIVELSRWEVSELLDLAEQRLDHLEANRKRVAKRRRKLKKERKS